MFGGKRSNRQRQRNQRSKRQQRQRQRQRQSQKRQRQRQSQRQQSNRQRQSRRGGYRRRRSRRMWGGDEPEKKYSKHAVKADYQRKYVGYSENTHKFSPKPEDYICNGDKTWTDEDPNINLLDCSACDPPRTMQSEEKTEKSQIQGFPDKTRTHYSCK